jgi:exopolysaccharide biosynthesis polyprenyl glycosylphosphotransferase
MLDITIIIIACTLALLLRFGGLTDVMRNQYGTLIFLLLLTLVVFYFYDLYNRFFYTQRLRVFFRIVKAWLISLSVYVIVGFVTKFAFLIESRVFIILIYAISIILFIIIRLIFVEGILKYYFTASYRKIPCKYIGPHNSFEDFNEFFKKNGVVGFTLIDSNKADHSDRDCNEILLYSKTPNFDELYDQIKSRISSGQRIHIASALFNELNLGWEWCRIDSIAVYTFYMKGNQRFRDFLRRCIDIIGSIFSLIVLAPLFAIISIAIKLDSRGSVIYKQTRCGKDGKRFVFYKFRSMLEHKRSKEELEAEANYFREHGVPKVETMDSEYITDIGKILRKTSIDEWPQFINVLKGEMSLIGPRPHRPHEVKCYRTWHKDRLSVKQGLTGLWQIYGRGELPTDKSIFLDLTYVINRSITLDIRLLFHTVPAVILGKGAY